MIPGADTPESYRGEEIPPEAITPVYNIPDTVKVFIRDTVYIKEVQYIFPDEIAVPYPAKPPKPSNPSFVALKTNLLYDAALLPNLTAEFYLGRKWSVAVEGNWSWWVFGSPVQDRWYHRIQVAGIELRKWVKSPYPLHGHAIGVYGMTGDYDLRLFPKNENSMGYLSYGWFSPYEQLQTKMSWSAGLSYAYSFPVARRFNLEFGLAVGYVTGEYYKYDYCMVDQQWEQLRQQAKYNRHYIGPTRVGVSLVWLLDAGNYVNIKKK